MGQICQVVQALMLTGEGRSRNLGRVFLLTQMAFVACTRVQMKQKGRHCLARSSPRFTLRKHMPRSWLLRALAVCYAGDDAP